jgi:hypothetical protein
VTQQDLILWAVAGVFVLLLVACVGFLFWIAYRMVRADIEYISRVGK